MKKFLYPLLLLLPSLLTGQEIRWSQYYAVMPALNPASTGAFGGDYRGLAAYRTSKYSASFEPFTTIYGSYDQGIRKHNPDGSAQNAFFAVGLSFLNDKAGVGSLSSTEVSGMFSFNLKIGKMQFWSVGVRAAYGSRTVDYTGFRWASQYVKNDGTFDPGLPADPMTDYRMVNYFPLSTGLMWNYSDPGRLKLNAGFAINGVNEPNVAFDADKPENLPMLMVGHVGADWTIPGSIISLMPLVLFQSRAHYSDLNFGLFAKWNLSFDSRMTHIKKTSVLYTGVFYRTTGDLVLATKFDLRRYLALGFSYDVGVDGDEVKGRSTMEFILTYSAFFMERSLLPHKATTEFF